MDSDSFTCPLCGRTSHNPNDVAAGYCGACHIGGLPNAMSPLAEAARAAAQWFTPSEALAEAMRAALDQFAGLLNEYLADVGRALAAASARGTLPPVGSELRAALDAAGLGEHGVRDERGDPTGDGPLDG